LKIPSFQEFSRFNRCFGMIRQPRNIRQVEQSSDSIAECGSRIAD